MFFARFSINGVEHAELYQGCFGWEKYHSDTFNPETKPIHFIEFKIKGTDYQSRKQCLYDIAVDWTCSNSEGLYISELCDIADWFYRMGKRYGLLQEFRENCIC